MMRAGVNKLLLGRRVLVTRPIQQAAGLSERLRELGAIPIEFPTIEISPVENTDRLDRAIKSLNDYDWIIFTSVHGVQFFLKRMAALGHQIETSKVKVAAIGPSTATALEQAGKRVDHIPGEYLSEKILTGLGKLNGKRVLLPRTNIASKKLPELLRNQGASVDEIITYQTVVPGNFTSEKLKSIFEQGVGLAIFTSPSSIQNLAQMLTNDVLSELFQNVKVACIGPVTADAARELGIAVEVVAKTHTIDGLVQAIVDEIRVA